MKVTVKKLNNQDLKYIVYKHNMKYIYYKRNSQFLFYTDLSRIK